MPGKRRKSRSFVISFGDIMLPLIGVVAVGLLLLAGRFFFTSGFSGGDSLPVMTPPQRERPAQAKERVPAPAGRASGSSSAAPSAARAAETARPVLAVPDVLALPAPSSGTAGKAVSSVKTHPKPRPALPPKAAPAKAASAKTPSPAAKPAPSQQKVQNTASGWRVQIGAFSARSAADDVVRRLSKEGYSAAVVSEKTVHRVLIRAKDKSDASALAARMERSGFPGAFVIAGP